MRVSTVVSMALGAGLSITAMSFACDPKKNDSARAAPESRALADGGARIVAAGMFSPNAGPGAGSIVDLATSAGQFTVLLQAVQAAGLADALSGPGPFTVFAPTDAAFKQLGMHRVEELLKPENRTRLQDILKYHVVPGRISGAELAGSKPLTSLDGQRLIPSIQEGQLRISGTPILSTDLEASNGVVHVVDRVLIPARDDIAKTAKSAKQFGTLLAAVKAAGLVEAISAPGPFTVLAPTDEAFENLPKGTVESLLKPENIETLRQVLKLHVIPARVYAAEALVATTAATLSGQSVTFRIDNGRLAVMAANPASIVKTDLDASNGVIHVIDRVLLPNGLAGSLGASTMTSKPVAGPAELLRLAIARGVPLFNGGNAAACAAVYEVAVQSVVSMPNESLPVSVREALAAGLKKAAASEDDQSKAWALREAMDTALARME